MVRDQGQEGAVTAVAAGAGTAVPFYKYFSDGRASLGQASGIEPGRYAFDLTQGAKTRTLEVDVAAKATWGQVLGAVRDAVNATDLTVRADITRQQAPFSLDPSLAGTGYLLALSVNPARADQDVTLRDASGHLLYALGMARSATSKEAADPGLTWIKVLQAAGAPRYSGAPADPGAATPLAVGRHDFAVSAGSDASGVRPTTYLSRALDPDAATALAPGTYAFGLEYAGQTRELSVTVRPGWTVGDVMRGVAVAVSGRGTMDAAGARINAPSFSVSGVSASLDGTSIPSAILAGAVTPGQMLTIAAGPTDDAGALKLTDGAGGVLASLGLTTALRGTPVSVTVQAGDANRDVAAAVARAVAMTDTRFVAHVLEGRMPSAAVAGKLLSTECVAVTLSLADKKISQTLTLADGPTGLLASLSLNRPAPGPDGRITADGRSMDSENGVYGLQQGRLTAATAREEPQELPLRVVAGMKRVEEETTGLVAAYNGVMRLAAANRDVLDPGLRRRLEAPVEANMAGLTRLGMAVSKSTGELWIDGRTFWRTLSAEGPGARDTLWSGDAALVPGWKKAVAGILRAGPDGFFAAGAGPGDAAGRTMSEFDLEKKNRLVDLLG